MPLCPLAFLRLLNLVLVLSSIEAFGLGALIDPNGSCAVLPLLTPNHHAQSRTQPAPPPPSLEERFKPPAGKPFLLGVSRDRYGKLQPIYSQSPDFFSVREIEFHLERSGWDMKRTIEEFPLEVVDTQNNKLITTPEFDKLPDDLARLFKKGQILVIPGMRVASLRKRVPSDYSVRMATVPGKNGSKGRTGYLMKKGIPFVLEIDGKEFLVEIKGVGNPDGGFSYNDPKHQLAIRGGLVESEAYRENTNLENDRHSNPDFVDGGTPRSAGYLTFDSPVGRQAYLVRLAPGSIRATFRTKDDLPLHKIDHAKVVQGMARAWAGFLARGSIPLSHPENIILSLDSGTYPTDYSDIIPIGRFPTRLENTIRTPVGSLKVSLSSISQLPDYSERKDFPILRKSVAELLHGKGRIPNEVRQQIESAKNTGEIGDLIWKEVLAVDYFRQHSQQGYIPFELTQIEAHKSDLDLNDLTHDLPRRLENRKEKLNSSTEEEHADIKKYQGYISERKQELNLLRTNRPEWDRRHFPIWRVKNIPMAEHEYKTHESRLEQEIARIQKDKDRAESLAAQLQEAALILDRTGYSLDGVLKMMDTAEYTAYMADGEVSPANQRAFLQISQEFGPWSNLRTLKTYLKDQINFLEIVQNRGTSEENSSIESNLREARKRLEELSRFNPYTFGRRLQVDPDYTTRMLMLPYHSRHFETNVDTATQPQYRHLPAIQRILRTPAPTLRP